MKNKLLKMISLLAIGAPIATLVSCGPKDDDVNPNGIKVAAVVTDPENPRWQQAKKELQSSGEKMGFNMRTNILKKQDAQNQWIALQIQKGIKGLIIGPTDESVGQAVQKANAKNIPVVAYDKLIKTNADSYNYYVAYDNVQVGVLQGLSILSALYKHPFKDVSEIAAYVKDHKLAKETQFLTLGGDPADNNAGLFWNGGHSTLKIAMDADPNLKEFTPGNFAAVAQAGWDYNKGQEFLKTQIGKDGSKELIKAILSPNDGMATAAIAALKATGLDPKDIYITGQDSNSDAIASIKGGTGQNMTISKPDSSAAKIAIGIIKELLTKKGANPEDVLKFLKATFPNIQITLDKAQYKATGGKVINTILLKPVVVNKDNVNKLFK